MYEFLNDNMFISCFYNFPNKLAGIKDSIVIVSKDKNGEKHIQEFENPEYTFYVHDQNYNMKGKEFLNYINIDDCKKVTCKYNSRYSAMVKASNNNELKKEYKRYTKNKEYKKLNNLHLYPEFHASDVNIEDFYIAKFLDQNDYTENNYGLSILSYDIEVDTSDYVGFPNEMEAPCPVNMITAYNSEKKILYVYALKYNTDTFKEFIERRMEAFNYILKKFRPILGKYTIKPKFYNSELALIANFFHQVNIDKPDYSLAWNCRFDFITLYERLQKLLAGHEEVFPEHIMCPEEIDIKNVFYKLDNSADDICDRADHFHISGYTNWMDAMCLYANITKPNGKKDSYELDFIGKEEVGIQKEEIDDIKTAHLTNYTNFYKYSAVDSLLLAAILQKTGHVELLHNIVTMTRTRPSKALKKTVSLRNYADSYYLKSNKTISNNHSYLMSQGEKIKGAFVALLTNIKKVGKINNSPSNKIFSKVIDFDLTSLYPSITMAFNISPDTMRYIISIHPKNIDRFTITHYGGIQETEKYYIGNFIEEYISGDVLNYCEKYHGVPSTELLYELISKILLERSSVNA